MDLFLIDLNNHIPNDKEVKMGILFDLLLTYIKERTLKPQKDDEIIEMLLKIFETKIFPLHKVNFMQYLPIYIIALSQEAKDAESTSRCATFTEKLLSFLIIQAVNKSGRREHLSMRQHAWNYLASLLSRECNILKPHMVIKCL